MTKPADLKLLNQCTGLFACSRGMPGKERKKKKAIVAMVTGCCLRCKHSNIGRHLIFVKEFYILLDLKKKLYKFANKILT
jgi:hypothetical protein